MNKGRKKIGVILAIIFVVVFLIFGVVSWKKSMEEREKIQKGVAYLESLEKKDTAEINEKVKKLKKEQKEKYMSEDETSVWTGFADAVIIGDSRAVGFSYYNFLADDQVYAEKGALITSVKENIQQVKAFNPGQIYICFGLNDLQSGRWSDSDSYSQQCADIIALLQEEIPQCDVYLNSILSVTEEKMESDTIYSSIDKYNASMKKMCEENGYNYIDNTQVCQEHMDLYEEDGLHLKSEFYRYWAMNMLLEVN